MRLLTGILVFTALGWADRINPTETEISEIIRKFAAKETEFATARSGYTYRQTSRIQEVGTGGGRWEEVVDIVFNNTGRREEKVVRAPVQSLRFILMSPEDLQDLRDTQPFVLNTRNIEQYFVRYLGKEKLDEIECFVFAVKPKKMEAGQRYFSGMIYVDEQDLQVVKSYGRAVGVVKRKGNEAYPKFETYREQIDGKFWFPTYTVSNDILHFDSGDVPIKMTVRYADYKQFRSESNIKFGDVVDVPPAGATTPGSPGTGPGASAPAPEAPKGPELAPPLARPTKKKKNN
ncbi:MAG: outer membrane lipoprotein-sorting protein [Bryobacteraceae bacterium]|nr:outer membrane lipoprotein-sorting protein [Bryobacteraceae bacterium]